MYDFVFISALSQPDTYSPGDAIHKQKLLVAMGFCSQMCFFFFPRLFQDLSKSSLAEK